MMKYTLLLLVGLVGIASANQIYGDQLNKLGGYIGSFLIGSCDALQENPDVPDTTTVCYKACVVSQGAITDAFNITKYSSSSFNMGDFNNFIQVFFIKLMTQMDKCAYNNFLLTVDNRMSSLPFLGGMLSKLGVEVA